MRNKDNHNRYTLFGVYEECKDEMSLALTKLPIGVTKMKVIKYRIFSEVIRLYFTIAFRMLIEGVKIPLLNKFGVLRVVKTQCIRYNPFKVVCFRDETGKVQSKKIRLKLKNGYYYFVFWDSPKIFRQYRFNINIKYKVAYMKLVNDGYDYLDYTLDGYGRNASTDYIQHIK